MQMSSLTELRVSDNLGGGFLHWKLLPHCMGLIEPVAVCSFRLSRI